MKKALFILEDINKSGSPQTALHFIMALEKKYDVHIVLLCIKNKNVDLARINDFNVHGTVVEQMKLPHMTTKRYKFLYPFYKKTFMNKVKKLFVSNNYDLVYSNRLSVSGPLFLCIKKHFPKTKTIYNSLGNIRERKESKYFFLRKRDELFKKSTINNTDYFISISEQGVFKSLDHSDNVYILKDYPEIELKKDKKIFSRSRTIQLGQIGYYCENKNQMFSLKLLKKLIDDGFNASLTFIGFEIDETKDYLINMKSFISDNSLRDKVKFLDSNSDKTPFFDSIDALLCPSHSEGLPIVTLESQYQKTPCITSLAIPEEANLGLLKRIPLNEFDEWINYLESENCKNTQSECRDLKKEFYKTVDSIIN